MQKKKFNQNLCDYVLSTVKDNLHCNALWVDDQFITYQEIIDSAKSVAATIQQSDITTSCIAIYCYRTKWSYICMLGAIFAGKTYVPLNPKFPASRNIQIITESNANIVCVDDRCAPQAAECIPTLKNKTTILSFVSDNKIFNNISKENFFVGLTTLSDNSKWKYPDDINLHDNVYLLFTSGTTGKPKGIGVSHNNLLAYLSYVKQKWPLNNSDRCTQLYDQTFDLSVHDIFNCFQAGACLYVVPEQLLLCPTDLINTHKLTCWGSVPSLLGFIKKFKRMPANAYPSLKYSFFCGEALPTDIATEWAKACPNSRIINLFGPTEATIAISYYELDINNIPTSAIMPIGTIFENQDAVIVNNQKKIVPFNEKGNLLLGGSQIVKGYWKDKTKTDQNFINVIYAQFNSKRWYNTGDQVSIDPIHGMMFHGRCDHQVKINGFRIELEEIAGCIRKEFSCTWAVAIPWPIDIKTGAAAGVVVWITVKDSNAIIDENKIKQFCARKLPYYMVPSRVFKIDEIPRNNNGKIDINKLQSKTNTWIKK